MSCIIYFEWKFHSDVHSCFLFWFVYIICVWNAMMIIWHESFNVQFAFSLTLDRRSQIKQLLNTTALYTLTSLFIMVGIVNIKSYNVKDTTPVVNWWTISISLMKSLYGRECLIYIRLVQCEWIISVALNVDNCGMYTFNESSEECIHFTCWSLNVKENNPYDAVGAIYMLCSINWIT